MWTTGTRIRFAMNYNGDNRVFSGTVTTSEIPANPGTLYVEVENLGVVWIETDWIV